MNQMPPMPARLTTLMLIMILPWLLLAGSAHGQECSPIVDIEPPLMDAAAAQRLARGEAIRVPFGVSVRASTESCAFILGFEISGTEALAAHIERRPFGERLLDLPQSNLDRLLSGVAEIDDPHRFELDLVLTPRPGLSSGDAGISLSTRIYSGTDPGTAVQTRSIDQPIPVLVPAHAEVTILSDQGRQALQGVSGLIDLGQLSSGARGQATIAVTGNTTVWLTVERSVAGLVHVEKQEYRVPYALWIEQQAVPSGSAAGLSIAPGTSAILRIQIGEIERLVSGSYRDAVRISVQAE
jgi:hypothetical protein